MSHEQRTPFWINIYNTLMLHVTFCPSLFANLLLSVERHMKIIVENMHYILNLHHFHTSRNWLYAMGLSDTGSRFLVVNSPFL